MGAHTVAPATAVERGAGERVTEGLPAGVTPVAETSLWAPRTTKWSWQAAS